MRTRLGPLLLAALVLAVAIVIVPGVLTHVPSEALAQDDGEIDPVDDADDDIDNGDNGGEMTPGAPEQFPIGGDDGETGGPPVVPAGEFRVEVLCEFTPEAGRSECAFTGMPPADASGVGYFLVPDEIACAAVVDGQFERAEPDPAIHLNGYRPAGGQAWLTLVLEGIATPAGQATYWFQTEAGVVAATGPALACSPAPPAQLPTAPPTTTPPAPTGSLVVTTHACVDVPADRTGFDWFGKCEPVTYGLTQADATGTPPAATAPAEATFEEVAPGTYDLELLGFSWCHAKSDNVTPESQVVIEAGERTTVWIFLCDDANGV